MENESGHARAAGIAGNRRRATPLVGLVACLAVLIAVGAWWLGPSGPRFGGLPATPASPGGSGGSPSSLVEPGDCAALGSLTSSSGELPRGATAVRLCDLSDEMLRAIAPPDVLTRDVEGLEAVYRGLERRSGGEVCTMELSHRYRMVFAYPDGSRVALDGELYGCRPVGDRLGADTLVAAFAERLAVQRASAPAPVPPASPTPSSDSTLPGCGPGYWVPQSYVGPTIDAIVGAYVCTLDSQGAAEPGRARVVPAADWPVLHADLVARTTRPDEITCAQLPTRRVVTYDAYGGLLSFELRCGTYWASQGGAGRRPLTLAWQPDGGVRTLLDTLAGG